MCTRLAFLSRLRPVDMEKVQNHSQGSHQTRVSGNPIDDSNWKNISKHAIRSGLCEHEPLKRF